MTRTGKLIVFEGPDGVGKSTLTQLTAAHLLAQDVPCEYLTFPGREDGTLGKLVYELHHEPLRFDVRTMHPASQQVLHIAAHIDAIERRILPALREGRYVLLDRFWWSTWVYGKVNGVPVRSLDGMIQVELEHWGDVLPAIVLLIDREAPLRVEEPGETWSKRRLAYHELAARQQRQHLVRVIENSGSLDDTLNRVIAALEALTNGTPDDEGTHPVSTPELPTYPDQGDQLHFDLDLQPPTHTPTDLPSILLSRLAPVEPSEVFDTYWRFAAERQAVFFRKWHGSPPPWTSDVILAKYKFTNAYRAADRVSQYLIKHVLYQGEQSPEEVFFRAILFKIFNRIDTWEWLQQQVGTISYKSYSFQRYDEAITKAMQQGTRIFSAAYIMPPGNRAFGHKAKHRNYLHLLELMMRDEVPKRVMDCPRMRDVFELLRSYPMIGDFLAYQYTIDINYSTLTNFSENEFVVPGPGALEGIRKCFTNLGGLNGVDIIVLMRERQEEEFARLGIDFRSLWGRPLQLIDCQNLFCEVDKYARLAHPDIQGKNRRKRIKQGYQAMRRPLEYWFPPDWGLNELMDRERSQRDAHNRGQVSG